MRDRYTLVSVDLDDVWTHYQNLNLPLPNGISYLEASVEQAIAIFGAHGIRATFFVIGKDADERPELLGSLCRRLEGAGHEIANHGYAHVPFGALTNEEMASDLRASTIAVQRVMSGTLVGFRAPAWSITKETFPLLEELSYAYDASLYPSPFAIPIRQIFTLRRFRWASSRFGTLWQNLGIKPRTNLELVPGATGWGLGFYSTMHVYPRLGDPLFSVQAIRALRAEMCSYVFHAIDFVDSRNDLTPVGYYNAPTAHKRRRVDQVLRRLSAGRSCIPLGEYVRQRAAAAP